MLLGQLGEPGARGRSPLWGGTLLLELDEYRRFRHRVRHLYGYELEAQRVLMLSYGVKPLLTKIEQAVVTFGECLQKQALSD